MSTRRKAPSELASIPASVDALRGIKLLTQQIEAARQLLALRPLTSDDYKAWETLTNDFLIKAFGSTSPNVSSVMEVGRSVKVTWGRETEAEYEQERKKNLATQTRILESLVESLQTEVKLRASSVSPADIHQAPGEMRRTEHMISVFISHSHQDGELVKRLITLLGSALNLPSNQIRATSVDGFRLPGGSNTNEQLRAEVQDAKVLIGVISSSSLKSAYVTFELGARWGSGKPMVPLLAPDVSPDLLAGPLQGINALSCRPAAQLYQLVEEMADHLSLPLDRPAAYQNCVDEIVAFSNGPGKAAKREVEPAIELTANHLAVIRVLAQSDHAGEDSTSVASNLVWNKVKAQHFMDDLLSEGYLEILQLDHGFGYGLSRKGRALAVKTGFTESASVKENTGAKGRGGYGGGGRRERW